MTEVKKGTPDYEGNVDEQDWTPYKSDDRTTHESARGTGELHKRKDGARISKKDARGRTVNEPSSDYGAEYPYNHVEESESGHVHERDDTPGHERLYNQHRSGTFDEVHPNGTKVDRIVGDGYTITLGNNVAIIQGDLNIIVDGDNILKANSVIERIVGNHETNTRGNKIERVDGKITIIGKGEVNIESAKKITVSAPVIDIN